MMAEHPAALTARELIAALVGQGVRDVVLAPGSRSAPLAYALAAAEAAGWLRVHIRVDERVAGFVALGIARVRPAAVVTTSGTAVANVHPAVLEAHHARLPLLVISADRPHELRGVGANQTTDQRDLFGRALRSGVDLPATHGLGVHSAVVRAVAAATGRRGGAPGPAQINVAFRDPLVPATPWRPGAAPAPPLVATFASGAPPVPLGGEQFTVVVAGDGAGPAAAELAQAAGWPLLAEPSSGVRSSPAAIAGYRELLPDLGPLVQRVVVFGRPTLSRQVSALLARTDVETIVVDPVGEWVDVAGVASVVAGAVTWSGGVSDPTWLDRWRSWEPPVSDGAMTGQALTRALLAADQPYPVVLGSSLTVRHADLVAPVGADFTAAPVVANRGLAGIDGTISTATGLALATAAPVRAVMGDLTFVHDVGGLAHGVHEPEVDLQVFVLNDHGGGIFATLEHGRAEHAQVFERYFGTEQHLDVAALARGFGADYHPVRSASELAHVLAGPPRGRSVVEVELPSR
ncbi:MAG: 2-succinyl-5-enolpyruvyl-6-hydroxy-3-cyclohexene-1-carboxylic-acid synthase [Beutenbergiaceae bacterium]